MSFELINITKTYENKNILKNFSISLPDSGTICFLGPNGIGKTTLLNIICGIDEQDSGNILNCNKDFSFVFQDERLIEQNTVIQNIEILERNDCEFISHILNRVALSSLKNELVCNLSKGQRQKLSIARALTAKFDILLLDEPFQGLDESSREDMIKLIAELSNGKLIILVTHSTYEAVKLSDEIYIVYGNPLKILKKMDISLTNEERVFNNKKFIYYQNQLKMYNL